MKTHKWRSKEWSSRGSWNFNNCHLVGFKIQSKIHNYLSFLSKSCSYWSIFGIIEYNPDYNSQKGTVLHNYSRIYTILRCTRGSNWGTFKRKSERAPKSRIHSIYHHRSSIYWVMRHKKCPLHKLSNYWKILNTEHSIGRISDKSHWRGSSRHHSLSICYRLDIYWAGI